MWKILIVIGMFLATAISVFSGTKENNYKPVVYVEMQPKPTPTSDENTRGFIVFSQHYLKMTFNYARPNTRISELKLFAAQGETVPVALNVYALRDMDSVSLEVSDLSGGDGDNISAANMQVRVVRYLNKRITAISDKYLVNAPSYLALQSSISLVADRTASFWIIFSSPQNAKPGMYTGMVTIRTKAALLRVPLNIRILPFNLPEPKNMHYGMYYSYGYYRDIIKNPDLLKKQIRSDFADMRAHCMTTVGISDKIDKSSYSIANGDVRFAFKGDTLFEVEMDAYKKNKFPEPALLLSDAAAQETASQAGKFGSPEFAAMYVKFHKALALEARKLGWPLLWIQPFDEPGYHTPQQREQNIYLLKLLKSAGIMTEQDGPADNYFYKEAGPYADLWTFQGAFQPSEIRRALAENHTVCVYNYDTTGWLGECSRWVCGFFNWKHDLNGAFNWAYFGGRMNLYNDFDGNYYGGSSGDWMHNYPPQDSEPGGPSVGWEAIRQGVNDRKYLELCESTITKSKQKGGAAALAADAAEKAINNLRISLNDNPLGKNTNMDWTMYLTEDDARKYSFPVIDKKPYVYVSGDYKYMNNLSFDDYDKIRWMIAVHIVNMLEKIGDIPKHDIGTPPQIKLSKSGQKSESSRKTARLNDLEAAPLIDGNVCNDDGWKGATAVNLSLSDRPGKPEMSTKVLFGLYGGILYVAFICEEEAISNLTAHVTNPNGPVWEDDCVEVFIDPVLTKTQYYQVLVNCLGTISIAGTNKWTPDIKAAAFIDKKKKEWTAEIAIPTGGMQLLPRFGMNFTRERRPLNAFELSAWSMTGDRFAKPDKFGTILYGKSSNIITSFEKENGIQFEATGGAKGELVKEHASDGVYSYKLAFPAAVDHKTYPGVFLNTLGIDADWTGHTGILADIFVEGDAPEALRFRVDAADKSAFPPASFKLKSGFNKNVRINLNSIKDKIDLSMVRSLLIYMGSPEKDFVLNFDNLRWDDGK